MRHDEQATPPPPPPLCALLGFVCLSGTSICASCSDVFILWLLVPAGPPSDTHWKECRAHPSWALPRQINNVNLGSVLEIIIPAVSTP